MLKLVHEVAGQFAKKLVHKVVWQAPQSMNLLGNLTIFTCSCGLMFDRVISAIALRSLFSSIRLSKRTEPY